MGYILLPGGDRIPAVPGKYRLTTPPDLNEVAEKRFLLEYVSPILTVRDYPMSGIGSVQRGEVSRQFSIWKRHNPEIGGVMFFHSAGYQLTTKAGRAWLVPDAAYMDEATFARMMSDKKLSKLPYPPCVPAVVLQLLTGTDNLEDAQAKVAVFMEAGTREGVIVDARKGCVWIYSRDQDEPRCESLGPIAFDSMRKFTLDCDAIRSAVAQARML
ncbi:hypothetical protein PHYSODRAFT_523758 [Phytophthora sojae]|uniref:Putative restriction endonuclease domain-containing protein n=1 Tax=Phytophthora sojae (strain P6497) TaxID=1094619 RepID=G5A3V5_PHYSP|nr:hypothetical protein PHYSODRAFT_523758 [Phytophthora sojae]EGZ09455.1 hypothetical protein PHYSODRAFT_523758 [Phytophthora sojae]|eukprot:XP_009534316.1 hypothetical protein PHYSODRAFT_523758 [Phytophthora sojae]